MTGDRGGRVSILVPGSAIVGDSKAGGQVGWIAVGAALERLEKVGKRRVAGASIREADRAVRLRPVVVPGVGFWARDPFAARSPFSAGC